MLNNKTSYSKVILEHSPMRNIANALLDAIKLLLRDVFKYRNVFFMIDIYIHLKYIKISIVSLLIGRCQQCEIHLKLN